MTGKALTLRYKRDLYRKLQQCILDDSIHSYAELCDILCEGEAQNVTEATRIIAELIRPTLPEDDTDRLRQILRDTEKQRDAALKRARQSRCDPEFDEIPGPVTDLHGVLIKDRDHVYDVSTGRRFVVIDTPTRTTDVFVARIDKLGHLMDLQHTNARKLIHDSEQSVESDSIGGSNE